MDNLVGAIVGHFVGDYLLQNDWMANNKKRKSLPCLVHVVLYTAAVMLFSGWFTHQHALAITAAIAIPHFIIDRSHIPYWYMLAVGQKNFAHVPMAPWSIIAVDNTMHFVCLWIVAYVVK